MTQSAGTVERIQHSVAQLGAGPLTETGVRTHLSPLFSRVLTRDANRSYLANHSLGRPLDAMQEDVREATSAWYERLGDAWEPWAVELAAHRRRLATLLGAARADCVVPNQRGRGSAGRAEYLRPCRARAQHTRRVRLAGRHPARVRAARPDKAPFVEPDADGMFDEDALAAAIVPGTDLVVVSQAWFMTGQLLRSPEALVERAHAVGAKVLLDVYHALGVLPVDIDAIGADFAVGGATSTCAAVRARASLRRTASP